MASQLVCDCGHVLRKNLFEGHGLHFLVAEELIDSPANIACDDWVNAMIQQSAVVMTCPMCEGITVDLPDGGRRRYALVKDDKRQD